MGSVEASYVMTVERLFGILDMSIKTARTGYEGSKRLKPPNAKAKTLKPQTLQPQTPKPQTPKP